MAEIRTAILEKAAELAAKVGYVFIVTSDIDGWPHLAAAGTLKLREEGCVTVSEWFCPGTISNLKNNRHTSIVVWEENSDTGYQLLGEMERMKDIGILNGYTPEDKRIAPIPQVESELTIRVRKITDFNRAPHSDAEE